MPSGYYGISDTSHIANKKTISLHTGLVMFINRYLIVCYIKRYMTVEWSTFSYECVVLKALVELVEHVKFKLRSFGITMVKFHATNIYCDNKSVANNTLLGESNLDKNSSSVAYHYMWYIVATKIITMAWI